MPGFRIENGFKTLLQGSKKSFQPSESRGSKNSPLKGLQRGPQLVISKGLKLEKVLKGTSMVILKSPQRVFQGVRKGLQGDFNGHF